MLDCRFAIGGFVNLISAVTKVVRQCQPLDGGIVTQQKS